MQRVQQRIDKLLENPAEWTAAEIPDLAAKIAIVTGANGGLGKQIALELAKQRCKVIMVCRDEARCNQAMAEIRAIYPTADLLPELADFSDLVSVHELTERLLKLHMPISYIFNNAGVLDLPLKLDEKDGLDATFKTNYLSHYLLTRKLLPLLEKDARIIFTGSTHHQYAALDFGDFQAIKTNDSRMAYNNSKWLLMSFCMELQRRLTATNSSILAVAAHPGFTATNILTSTTGKETGFFKQLGYRAVNTLIGQKPEKGALPLLYAALGLKVKGGDYYGPDGAMQYSGKTQKTECVQSVYDKNTAYHVWEASESLLRLGLAACNNTYLTIPPLEGNQEPVAVMKPM